MSLTITFKAEDQLCIKLLRGPILSACGVLSWGPLSGDPSVLDAFSFPINITSFKKKPVRKSMSENSSAGAPEEVECKFWYKTTVSLQFIG
ncbi:hypothetical protein QTP88_023470 [Uroleucon formosanum]